MAADDKLECAKMSPLQIWYIRETLNKKAAKWAQWLKITEKQSYFFTISTSYEAYSIRNSVNCPKVLIFRWD